MTFILLLVGLVVAGVACVLSYETGTKNGRRWGYSAGYKDAKANMPNVYDKLDKEHNN